MNKIKKIENIVGLGVYDSFNWACHQEFSKQNILFGFNGSGKTTLSCLFNLLNTKSTFSDDQKLELYDDLKTKEGALFKVKDSANNLISYPPNDPQNNLRTYVFNSNFVADHVFDGQSSKLQKFNVNVTSLENPEIKRIDEKIESHKIIKSENDKIIDEIENKFASIKTKYNSDFRTDFPNKKLSIGKAIPSHSILAKTSLEELKKTLNYKLSEYQLSKKQNELDQDIWDVALLELKKIDFDFDQFQAVLESTAKENTYSALKKRIEKFQHQVVDEDVKKVEPWYKFGYTLLKTLKESNGKKCPLCESDLDNSFEELMSDFANQFDKEYELLLSKIYEFKTSIAQIEKSKLNNSNNVLTLKKMIEKYQKYFKDKIGFPEISDLNISVASLKNSINDKEGNSGKAIKEDFGNSKSILEQYNQGILKLEQIKQSLEDLLESIKVDPKKCESEIRNLYQEIIFFELNEGAKKKIELYENSVKANSQIDEEITKLTNDKADKLNKLKIEADKVNDYLLRLGIQHFSIDLNKDKERENILIKYKDQDDYKKRLRNTLSEGEKTALAFSYFLSKISAEVKDKSKINVVIDDPISSLDDNRLYNTAYLISDEFKNSNQLFVLSHNLLFLKYLNPLLKESKSSFMVTKGEVLDLPNSIKNFQSPYFYMLEDIVRFKDNDSDHKYEEARKYLPNYVRRVLETYMSFKFATIVTKRKDYTPGLPDFINDYIDYENLPEESKGDVNKVNLKEKLSNINKQCDNFSHGSTQQLDECNFMSNESLTDLVTDTINVLDFLDGKHLEKALELMGVETANDDELAQVS